MLLSEYFHKKCLIVEAFGVYVLKFVGDTVLAFLLMWKNPATCPSSNTN